MVELFALAFCLGVDHWLLSRVCVCGLRVCCVVLSCKFCVYLWCCLFDACDMDVLGCVGWVMGLVNVGCCLLMCLTLCVRWLWLISCCVFWGGRKLFRVEQLFVGVFMLVDVLLA